MNRYLVSKHHQSELTAKQNMELCQEEMGLYICVSLTKDTVKKYGIMLLEALLWLVLFFIIFFCFLFLIISFREQFDKSFLGKYALLKMSVITVRNWS